jgi:uncharacterized protein with GYD domain
VGVLGEGALPICPLATNYRYDGLLIYEAPDDASAGAAVLVAASRGHLRATKTTPLFSVEEGMEIMRRAGATAFRAPGQ